MVAEFRKVINGDSGSWIAASHPETRASVSVSLSVCGRSEDVPRTAAGAASSVSRGADGGRKMGGGWEERFHVV